MVALGLLLATTARAETVTIQSGDVALQAQLYRPAEGVPPAAPVVALHGCGGAYSSRDAQWARVLTEAGHTVLFPDSFGSRGLGSQCRLRQRMPGLDAARRRDALAASAWLAARPGVPAGGVVLVGWSNGGGTVLRAGAAGVPDLPAGLLRGLVAFYPGCRARLAQPGWQPAAPLLLLIGEADDWTPAAPCKALAERVPMTLHLYPGAYHDFDAPGGVRVRQGIAFSQNADGSVHAGGDPVARADALQRVPTFLASLPPAKLSP